MLLIAAGAAGFALGRPRGASHPTGPGASHPTDAADEPLPACPAGPDRQRPVMDRRYPAICEVRGQEDVYRDGIADCWTEQSWGDGVDQIGATVTLQRDCAGPVYAADVFRHRQLDVATIDPALAYRPLLRWAAARMIGRDHVACDVDDDCPRPTGALAWLLDAARSEELTPADILSRRARYTPHWAAGTPVEPAPELLILDDVDAPLLVDRLVAGTLGERDDRADQGPYLVAHNARYHDGDELRDGPPPPLARVASCPAWDVWLSPAGVAVVDRRRHQWSWVLRWVDRRAFEGGDFTEAACDGGLVWVRARTMMDGRLTFVVDPRTGHWGELGVAPADPGWSADAYDVFQQVAWERDPASLADSVRGLHGYPRVIARIRAALAR